MSNKILRNSLQYKPGFFSVRNFQHSFANIVLFSLAFYEFGDICNHSLNHADVIDFTRKMMIKTADQISVSVLLDACIQF